MIVVVRKIYSARDLESLYQCTKFSQKTRRAIKDAANYLKDVVERYSGAVQPGMLKGTINFQLDQVRPLIKADIEMHAKDLERTAEFEKREEKKLLKISRVIILASIVVAPFAFILPPVYAPLVVSVSVFGILLSAIVYTEALFCAGRAMAKKDNAQIIREFDVEAG